MSRHWLRLVLRTTAIAIAMAGVIDPVMTVSRQAPRRVVLARLASADTAAVESAVRAGLPGVDVSIRSRVDGRLPCDPGVPCIVLADGSIEAEIPSDVTGPLSVIELATPAGPNVEIRSVTATSVQRAAGAGLVRVTMTGEGMQGRRTEVRVLDGGALVGSASHEWSAGSEAVVDVPWWALAAGSRALRVEAVPFDGEATLIDNAVDVGVSIALDAVPVLVFDTRPSWASTFVRRVLEDDQRFRVEYRVGLAPGMDAATPAGRLDPRSLDAAGVVVVGGPEGLSARDVDLLERFVRTRGGTLILLPDRMPAGPVTRLLGRGCSEHLEASPAAVGSLRASETLRLAEAGPGDVTLGGVNGRPVMVLSPRGNGRLVVSGAMDAWRYRDADAGAFDGFWRSVVLEAGVLSASLRLEFAQPIAAVARPMPFVVRSQRMDPAAAERVWATVTCVAEATQVVRLWPGGAPGVFTGVVPGGREACQLQVALDDGSVVSGGLAVTAGASDTVSAVLARLVRAAHGSGGVVARAGEEQAVTSALASGLDPGAAPIPIRPMQSPWWMFPFVTALGAEWWLRRRSGLR